MAFDFSRLNSTVLTTFGETVSYTHDGGSAYDLSVIRTTGEAAEGERATHILFARAADFEAEPRKGDTVVIDGGTHRVSFVEDTDAAGGRRFHLQHIRT